MAITPRGLLVEGPDAVPGRYGLLSVVTPRSLTDPHWEAGLEFETDFCDLATSTLPDCGLASTPPVKEPDGGPMFHQGDPFTIIGSYECSVGGRSADQAFTIARTRLTAWEQNELERVFWSGVTPAGDVNPSLTNGDSEAGITPTDLSPVGVAGDAQAAIGALEAAMATCVPGLGIIHVPTVLAATLVSENLVKFDGTVYRSPMGHPVVFGSGYTNTGPGEVVPADGEAWMFATGPIAIWQGDVFLTPDSLAAAIDTTLNNVTVFAERTWAVGISCCLFAIRAGIETDSVTIETGDLEIGAVEIQDGTSGIRAAVATAAPGVDDPGLVVRMAGSAEISNDVGNPIPVNGTVALDAPTLAALESITITDVRPATSVLTTVASSASTVVLKAANTARLGLMIFNDSTAVLYLAFAATATTSAFTVKIGADGYYELPGPVYTGAVSGIWASANGNARVTEVSA